MPPKSRREENITVKVETQPRRRVAAPNMAAAVHHAPHPTKPLRGVDAVPVERRRQLLWISVVVCAVIILGSWGFIAKYEYSSPSGDNQFLKDISGAIKNFHLPGQEVNARNSEAQKLDQQVFPQFQH